MSFVLFVILVGANGIAESGFLPFADREACETKKSWYLERLVMNDGEPAQSWAIECMPVAKR